MKIYWGGYTTENVDVPPKEVTVSRFSKIHKNIELLTDLLGYLTFSKTLATSPSVHEEWIMNVHYCSRFLGVLWLGESKTHFLGQWENSLETLGIDPGVSHLSSKRSQRSQSNYGRLNMPTNSFQLLSLI